MHTVPGCRGGTAARVELSATAPWPGSIPTRGDSLGSIARGLLDDEAGDLVSTEQCSNCLDHSGGSLGSIAKDLLDAADDGFRGIIALRFLSGFIRDDTAIGCWPLTRVLGATAVEKSHLRVGECLFGAGASSTSSCCPGEGENKFGCLGTR